MSEEALIDQSIEGINIFSPIISIALAGVGSGRDKFSNQLSLLDEILYPKDWGRGGLVIVTELPNSAAFIYQALHGAMCLYTDQAKQAIEIVRSRIKFPDWNEPIPIWQNHEIMGWPRSLTGNSTKAWGVLAHLTDKYPWVSEIFGDKDDYLTALVAYYAVLNINEYSYAVKDGLQDKLNKQSYRMDIPLCFERVSDDIRRRAYNLVIQDREQLKNIWGSLGVTDEQFSQSWTKWKELCSEWLNADGQYWGRQTMLHGNLVEDLSLT